MTVVFKFIFGWLCVLFSQFLSLRGLDIICTESNTKKTYTLFLTHTHTTHTVFFDVYTGVECLIVCVSELSGVFCDSHSLQHPIRTYPAPNANASSKSLYFCVCGIYILKRGKTFYSINFNNTYIFRTKSKFWQFIFHVSVKLLFSLLIFYLDARKSK